MLQKKMPYSSNKKEFCLLAEQISNIAGKHGIKIAPYNSEALPHFSKLDENAQVEILNQLRMYVHICQKTLEIYGSLHFSTQMIWVALKELQLIPCSDLFTKITSEDVIEIHDLGNKQIFRNLRYFEFCSYTLEEVHCVPWTELYYRPVEDLSVLLSFAENIIKNPPRSTIACDFGPQLIQELNSSARLSMSNTIKYYSPLFDNTGSMVAAMAIESPKLIKSTEKNISHFPPMEMPAANILNFEFKN